MNWLTLIPGDHSGTSLPWYHGTTQHLVAVKTGETRDDYWNISHKHLSAVACLVLVVIMKQFVIQCLCHNIYCVCCNWIFHHKYPSCSLNKVLKVIITPHTSHHHTRSTKTQSDSEGGQLLEKYYQYEKQLGQSGVNTSFLTWENWEIMLLVCI